ncbi:MAG: hypothetical protein H8D23_09975 [Candidatus Brocadiales bacterium]|nr:hypothetical protein [Candidatus Brocadiales bacterium]
MNTYIVSFEINKAETKASFVEGMKSYGYYCPICETAWAIKTEKTAAIIRDHLGSLLDSTDRVFVLRSGTEAAWKNSYGSKHDDWLKGNL